MPKQLRPGSSRTGAFFRLRHIQLVRLETGRISQKTTSDALIVLQRQEMQNRKGTILDMQPRQHFALGVNLIKVKRTINCYEEQSENRNKDYHCNLVRLLVNKRRNRSHKSYY